MATGQTHGGKGSATRPTDKKKYEDNYDAIFGKKKNTDKPKSKDKKEWNSTNSLYTRAATHDGCKRKAVERRGQRRYSVT